ncbi:rhamnulose-1-phosphate aldolase [Flagellimonas sp. CMM7]|uniref:rhamnulose-1-phosphate aldolase n=1 Tax=Flagellimonas sp. CMM7 TaxID=2654676 RepID=UPI0013D6190C|nr:rhamnulose-1-phosphate aldolase [Flagellimonas sp. CMM7]UII78755.1 rhamnulose-1-phosphate aldolase [Flagellimonas sp. CMM7]
MSTYELPNEVTKEIDKISMVAGYLWQREWVERNGGNISINMTPLFSNFTKPESANFIAHPFPKEAAGLYIFVTGAGCYIRSLIDAVETASCILYINEQADGYTIVWGGKEDGFRPTSELASHLQIHLFNKENNPNNLAVLHAHPIELIVLSHHALFKDEEKLNHAIWQMCPEVRVYVPRGIHCTPYAITQSDELAKSTTHAFTYKDIALWEKHGATTTAEDIEKAWDFLDVANKGAKLLLTAWASGFEPEGLSKDQLQGLEELFKL